MSGPGPRQHTEFNNEVTPIVIARCTPALVMRNTDLSPATVRNSSNCIRPHKGYRALGALLIGVALVSLGISRVIAAPPPDVRPEFPDIKLPNRMRGEEALDAIGSKLSEMAAYYKTTPGELRQRMQRDKSLWVDK